MAIMSWSSTINIRSGVVDIDSGCAGNSNDEGWEVIVDGEAES
jgi:hypothetical protein